MGQRGPPEVRKQMSAITETAEGDTHTWVANELYEELLKMPFWVECAFGQNGEFVFDRPRQDLAAHLVGRQMQRCPTWAYNTDYRHDWKLSKFVPLFRQAWTKAVSINPYRRGREAETAVS